MSRNTAGRLGMAILLFAVVAGFYWRLTLTRQFDWIWGADLSAQVLPWFQEQARQWHEGRFPLWDPYLWAGQPLPGQAQPGAVYPLNWILFALPLHNGHIMQGALTWYFVAIRLMAASFCYLLCRDLGRSRAAALAGACVFSLAGYVATTGWPQMVNGAVWLPLIFLFLLRAARGINLIGSAALSGAFLGVAWLSGHHQVPMYASLAAAGAWLFLIFRSGRPNWPLVKAAMTAASFTGLSGALQILPAMEYGRLAERWSAAAQPQSWGDPVPYYVHEEFSLRGGELLGILFPGIGAKTSPYLGAVALALAMLGAAACWRELRVRLLAGVGLGGLLYALGPQSVFQGFLYAAVPMVDKARTPAMAVVVFEFAVAVLAAYGFDRVGSIDSLPWQKRAVWGTLSFGALTMAIFMVLFFVQRSFPGDNHVMITGLVSLLLAAILAASVRGALTSRQAGVLLVLLLLLDLGSVPNSAIGSRFDKDRRQWLDQMTANQDIARFLKAQPGYFRTTIAADAFFPNWGAWHGVEMWGGYLASITTNVWSTTYSPQARALYGVAYTIAANPGADAGRELYRGASGMAVYARPDAFPRAWAVHHLRRIPDRRAGNELIASNLPDFHEMAFMLQPPPALESCGATDDVTLREHQPDRLVIHANMSCRGMVVLSDTYYPGWVASIDGRPATIHEVNGAMRGVVTPRGEHRVEMRYRPVSVFAGALMSFAGVSGAVLLACRRRRTVSSLPQPK